MFGDSISIVSLPLSKISVPSLSANRVDRGFEKPNGIEAIFLLIVTDTRSERFSQRSLQLETNMRLKASSLSAGLVRVLIVCI